MSINRHLWLALIILMFLPTSYFSYETNYGVLEISDLLVFPLIFTLYFAQKKNQLMQYQASILQIYTLFMLWATFGVFMITLKYQYINEFSVFLNSMLKLGKFFLFSFAAYLAWRNVHTTSDLRRLNTALLVCGMIVSLSLILAQNSAVEVVSESELNIYKSMNQMGVTLAVLILYLSGVLLAGVHDRNWNVLAVVPLIIMLVGLGISRGRGAWVAAILGFAFFFIRRGRRAVSLAIILLLIVAPIVLYKKSAAFRNDVKATFYIEESNYAYKRKEGDVRSGYRIQTWLNQAGKFDNNPFFGTGFSHRGTKSGLYSTGSHNFWLQMFLETGFVGGLLMLILLYRLWCVSTSQIAKANRVDVTLQACLICIFVSGLSGEYFYGGLALFTSVLVFASAKQLMEASHVIHKKYTSTAPQEGLPDMSAHEKYF